MATFLKKRIVMLLVFSCALIFCLTTCGLSQQEQTFLETYSPKVPYLPKRIAFDSDFADQIIAALKSHWKKKQESQTFMNSMAVTIELLEQFTGSLPEDIQKIKEEILTFSQAHAFADPFQSIKKYLEQYEIHTGLVQASSPEYMQAYFNTLNTYLDPLETKHNYDQLLVELLKAMPRHTVLDYINTDEQTSKKSLPYTLEVLSFNTIPKVCKELLMLPAPDAYARLILLRRYAEYVDPRIYKEVVQALRNLEACSQTIALDMNIPQNKKTFIEYIDTIKTIFEHSKEPYFSKEAILNILTSRMITHTKGFKPQEKTQFQEYYATFICLTRDTLPALFLYRKDNAPALCNQYLDFVKEFLILSAQSLDTYTPLMQKVFGWREKECSTFPLKAKIDLANLFEYYATKTTVLAKLQALLGQPLRKGKLIDFTAIQPLTSSNAKSYFTTFEKQSLEQPLTIFYLVKNIRDITEFATDSTIQTLAHDSALISYTLCYLANTYSNLLNDRQPYLLYQHEIEEWTKSTGFKDLNQAFSSLKQLITNHKGSELAFVDTSLKTIFGIPQERLENFESAQTQNLLQLINAYLNGAYVYEISRFAVNEKKQRDTEIYQFLQESFIDTNLLEYIQRDPAGLWSKISNEPLLNAQPPLQQLYAYLAYVWDRISE